jgi:hypothetical protein
VDNYLLIFDALHRAGVRNLVVGGVATVLHGYARFTADIDLIVQLDRANCLKTLGVLHELGFRPRAPVDPAGFADPEIRAEWIENKGLTIFSFVRQTGMPIEIDLFVEEPMDFDELWSHKTERSVSGVSIQVVDKASLIAMKKASGRPQDLEDIKALEATDDGS